VSTNREEMWLWLCSNELLYRKHIANLLEWFGSLENIWHASSEAVNRCCILSDSQKAALIKSRYEFDMVQYQQDLFVKGIKFISVENQEYPRRLKDIVDYPYGLFVKGSLPPEEKKAVAIVGSRKCSYYGRKTSEKIAAELALRGVAVISGMAAGIDGYAQQKALETGGQSFGVLGSGVDVCYPRQHQALYQWLSKKGGIISEYPPGRAPLALHFPIRNRIISGLADQLLVVEAKVKSGTLITADLAIEQGKDIFAVPGRHEDSLSGGCNRLIQQGAGIFLSTDEFLEQLKITGGNVASTKKNNISLETKEKVVYSCVDLFPKSLSEIVGSAKLPIQEVLAVLTVLVLKGYIEETMKNYYVKIE